MASQNNAGLQHQKDDAVTVVATAAIAINRIVAYDGAYATAAGGAKDAQGVSEADAAIGDAVSVVTEYSYLVECSEAIAFGNYVKPAIDGTGRGAVGTLTDHCGRALGATTVAGQLFEMQIVKHVHA
jgi:hypothetical protein